MHRRASTSAGLAHWSAARGRNALRRVRLMSTVGVLVGVGVFAVLQLLPREADRALRARLAALPPSIDTASLEWMLARARDSMRARQAELSALQTQRQQDSLFVVSVTDAAGVPRVTVGDTLRAQLAEQLQLARTTPIVEGFLSLAASPALASDTVAQLLADSLRDAERERGAFAAVGGPDLRYRVLQTRVMELGERLAVRAELRLRDSPALPAPSSSAVDTALTSATEALRIAADSVAELETSLRRASEWNVSRAAEERALRAADPIRVPWLAMLCAVFTIAISTAYVVAFAVEWRHPRIADMTEVVALVEQQGLDATMVIQEWPSRDLRLRRAADRALPPVLRRDTRAYDRLHQLLSTIGDATSVVGVVGENAEVTAAVAVQLAAAAAAASRAVVLIDADLVRRRVAELLGYSANPGLADVARGRLELGSALVSVRTGRDHGLALLSAGHSTTPRALLEEIAPEMLRLMQRHDVSVLAMASDAPNWPTPLWPRDVVVAVAPGLTRVQWLSSALRTAAQAGRRVRGVLVLQNA